MNVSPSPRLLQTLVETLKCFICLEKLQDAHLCPHCSKLCCYACIHQSLTQQGPKCPHCRVTLRLHEIVKCRWAKDLTEQIDSMNINDLRCETHDKELDVFCVTCNLTICHQCALFDSSSHSGHSFQPIEKAHNKTLKLLDESCYYLKTKEELIKEDINELVSKINGVKQAKERKIRETRTLMEFLLMELEKDFDNSLVTLSTLKSLLFKECEHIKNFLLDHDLKLSGMPMVQLIKNAPELNDSITAMQNKQIPALMPLCLDFHSEMIPIFEEGTLIIKSFSDIRLRSEPIYSLPVGCNGIRWRLKVYPNNGFVADRYLSAFLELTSGPPFLTRYDCCIEIINHSNNKNVLKEFTTDFKISQCRGFHRFVDLSLLNKKKFLKQGSLVLKFNVRPYTYFQKCKELQWYLSKLDHEKSVILQQSEGPKQEISDLSKK